jgi:hypothetical protein
MPLTTETRRDAAFGTTTTRRFGLPALLITALASLLIGWFGGQAAEKNNADNIPGGAPTDGVSGTTQSDR